MSKTRIKKRLIKKQGKKNFIKEQYKLCWNFLLESANFIALTLVLFLFFAFIGFIKPEYLNDLIINIINQLIDKTKDMGFLQLLLFIFQNNIVTSFLGLVFGILFGIIPFLIIIFNGYILGFVARKSVDIAGYSVLLKIFPHGIFELPAVIISIALGIKLGMFILGENKKKELKYRLENSLRVFLFIVIPLLLIAGIIETSLIFLFK